jgi:hypothetical protein
MGVYQVPKAITDAEWVEFSAPEREPFLVACYRELPGPCCCGG